MAHEITLEPTKTYASRDNAVKAVERYFSEHNNLRYIIMKDEEGRYYPVFVGQSALQNFVFTKFPVIN